MAGSATLTEKTIFPGMKEIVFDWVSDASGAVSAVAQTTEVYSGDIVGLITDPDGTAAPEDNYDIVINDDDGVDILIGAGANRSTSATQAVQGTSLGFVCGTKLDLVVSNAGNAKAGKVKLFVR